MERPWLSINVDGSTRAPAQFPGSPDSLSRSVPGRTPELSREVPVGSVGESRCLFPVPNISHRWLAIRFCFVPISFA